MDALGMFGMFMNYLGVPFSGVDRQSIANFKSFFEGGCVARDGKHHAALGSISSGISTYRGLPTIEHLQRFNLAMRQRRR